MKGRCSSPNESLTNRGFIAAAHVSTLEAQIPLVLSQVTWNVVPILSQINLVYPLVN